jgi:drug/metabolite transporter (DMT)-like permease
MDGISLPAEAWIPFTLLAAFFQNLRSALQKHLKGRLSNNAAAYARFLYALPFAALYLWFLLRLPGTDLPQTNGRFLLYCLFGGVCQIIFTVMLLWMFSFRSFAVGTTFSKLEVVSVAVFGAVFLGDLLNHQGLFAIAICTLGVIALSSRQTGITASSVARDLWGKETAIGLVCSLFLGASVVFFRAASLSLGHDDAMMSAAFTLVVALCIQCVVMGAWLIIVEPQQLRALVSEWKWAGIVGIAGTLASIGWFTAFTLQNASYVRTLGQIELLFTYLFTTRIFKEQVSRIEIIGIALVALGIVILLLSG